MRSRPSKYQLRPSKSKTKSKSSTGQKSIKSKSITKLSSESLSSILATVNVKIIDPNQPRLWIRTPKKDLDPGGKILKATLKHNEAMTLKYNELLLAVKKGNPKGLSISFNTSDIRKALAEDEEKAKLKAHKKKHEKNKEEATKQVQSSKTIPKILRRGDTWPWRTIQQNPTTNENQQCAPNNNNNSSCPNSNQGSSSHQHQQNRSLPVPPPPPGFDHTHCQGQRHSQNPMPETSPQCHNNYKFGPFKPPSQAIPQYAQSKPSMGLQYFHPQNQIPQSGPPSQSVPQHQHHPHGNFYSHCSHSGCSGPQPTVYTYANAGLSRSPQQSSREDPKNKHVSGPMFLHQGNGSIPRGYVLHQSVEHPSTSLQKYGDDGPKYYHQPPSHSLGLRAPSHLSIHLGLTIQSSQNVPNGGITSGFLIRTQPKNVSAYQGRPQCPPVAYSMASNGGPPRLTYGHAHHQPHHSHCQLPQHIGAQRCYSSLHPGVQRD